MKVKICGITREEDAYLAAESGADYLGFIFYKGSPRYITPDKVRLISRDIPAAVERVGVFVNETVREVENIYKEAALDIVQLHSVIDDFDYLNMSNKNIPYVRVLRVRDDSIDTRHMDDRDCYGLLLDSYDKEAYGGTGKAFDWDIAKNISHKSRIFLSGGLTAENVGKAIQIIKPYAVDVSSGVESTPGIKDPRKIKQFIDRVKGAKE